MKIAVLSNQAPFVRGGAEELADALARELEIRGHEAEVFRIPFSWTPPGAILDHMLAARLWRLGNVDRVVALKFPGYLVPHENKVVWLLHQFRQAYDLWGTPYQDLPDTIEGHAVRDAVRRADQLSLPAARAIFTNSAVTSERLERWNGLASEVLLPPLIDGHLYREGPYGDYVFCPGRIGGAKRQALLVAAMRHTRSSVRLVVAGAPDSPQHGHALERLVRHHDLADRVKLIPHWISTNEKADLYAGARAVAYAPYEEDSYGYVTLEACSVAKPVITCTDSGGTHALVENDLTGLSVDPTPEAIALGLDEIMVPGRAQELGLAARLRVQSLGITWDDVVARLTA